MATAGEILRRNLTESFDLSGDSQMGSGELHVLAVDDSHVDRKVIERLLKISSCKVTAVDSGTRALEYLGLDGEKSSVGFDNMKVNLIITDYSMPGMTGYELLKKIKESSAFREVPVVIMSSENILTRIDRCLEEGAEEYIVKPVKLSDVNRLKNFMMGGGGERKETEEKKSHKRTFSVDYNASSSPSSLPQLSQPFACNLASSHLTIFVAIIVVTTMFIKETEIAHDGLIVMSAIRVFVIPHFETQRPPFCRTEKFLLPMCVNFLPLPYVNSSIKISLGPGKRKGERADIYESLGLKSPFASYFLLILQMEI